MIVAPEREVPGIMERQCIKPMKNAVLKVRSEKLDDPKVVGNAGSFFKNPIIDSSEKERLEKNFSNIPIYPFGSKFKISAGWLIEN